MAELDDLKKARGELQNVIDLMLIDTVEEKELMTLEEITNLLGVEADAEGKFNSIKLFNACLHIQTNPNVCSLPQNERLRALATASQILGSMRG